MPNITRMRNTELRKALATTGSGQYLVPEDLEPMIRDYLWYLSPLTERLPLIGAGGHIHEVVKKTAVARGWFEGESTDPSYSQSTYARRQVELKIMRIAQKVTGFQQSASRTFVDAVAEEIDTAVMSFADLMEFSAMWAVSDDLTTYDITGDGYQTTGLYGWMLQDNDDADGSDSNIYDANANGAAGATVTLSMLDTIYARTVGKYRNFMRDPYIWLMSQSMIDKVSGLQTRISRDVPRIEFEGGFVMSTYKGVPIMPSQFCAPTSSTATPTSLAAATASGGSLADDTYYYRVAAITLYGEQVAAAEVNATTSGTHSSVTLTWTADANAKSYAIYRGLTTGDNNLGLLDITPAKTYAADGSVSTNVASYTDDGTITATATINPVDSGEESIFLVNYSREHGLSRVVLTPSLGDPVNDLLHYVEIPVATDELAFRIQGYNAMQVPWGQSSGVIRRAKIS